LNEKTGIELRIIAEGFGASIVEVHREAFNYDEWKYTIYGSQNIAAYIDLLLQDKSNRFVGAFDRNNRLIAYMHLRLDQGQTHLNYIATRKSARLRGIGSQLLSHLFDNIDPDYDKQLTLDVRQDNDIVRNWYLSQGFSPSGISSSYISIRPSARARVDANSSLYFSKVDRQRLRRFGFAETDICVHGTAFRVGVLGNKLFRVSGPHNQELIDTLLSLNNERSVLVHVGEEEHICCQARWLYNTIRMIKKL
jgi:ribosomal protein S18 acetylase RimI-like enzyme